MAKRVPLHERRWSTQKSGRDELAGLLCQGCGIPKGQATNKKARRTNRNMTLLRQSPGADDIIQKDAWMEVSSVSRARHGVSPYYCIPWMNEDEG